MRIKNGMGKQQFLDGALVLIREKIVLMVLLNGS
jgi:hypothetical protein